MYSNNNNKERHNCHIDITHLFEGKKKETKKKTLIAWLVGVRALFLCGLYEKLEKAEQRHTGQGQRRTINYRACLFQFQCSHQPKATLFSLEEKKEYADDIRTCMHAAAVSLLVDVIGHHLFSFFTSSFCPCFPSGCLVSLT